MAGKIKSKVPSFFGLRIYILATLLYFFLVMPVAGILLFKYGPMWVEMDGQDTTNVADTTSQRVIQQRLETFMQDSVLDQLPDEVFDSLFINHDTLLAAGVNGLSDTIPTAETLPNEDLGDAYDEWEFGGTLYLLLKLLLISFILGFSFSLPFKIYFRRKRKHKTISDKLYRFVRKLLIRTPLIFAGILFLSFGITLGYMAYKLFIVGGFNEITQKFYEQFFFITFVSVWLTILFVYYWQKHRVHILYIEHVYTKEELTSRLENLKEGKIRNRFWIASAMTSLMPLIIVVFYLFISISKISDLGVDKLTPDQLEILIGKYSIYFGGYQDQTLNGLFYVNVFDSLLMFAGIFTGIFIALIYLLFFIRWTTIDIVYPVRELLSNMQRTGRGELDNLSIVRMNDEIGELTEGYNVMSKKLKEYIINISRINEANARFVPRQFLDYLGKDSISEIKLGDQVQKEMTILFTDIRDFTMISEQMTPKENFDFLNNYLGYMEPVISNNNGFIDKFIGDSIMALFPDNTEDAINAAIEMKIKLTEFNQITSQFGQPPITIGIGIHTGMLMLGVVGGEGRMDGTVISDAVNLTSRLEGLTKIYGASIIISEDSLIKINDPTNYQYRFLDIVMVKGKKKAIYIFEVLDGESEDLKTLKINSKKEFSKAVQLFKDKDFEKAKEAFEEVIKINPGDLAATRYIERCERLIDAGSPEDWDGIEKF